MEDKDKILIGIVTQQFQPVTSQDVLVQAKKIGYELEVEDIIYVLENMQRRDLLSVIYQSRGNKRVKAYGMAKPIFKKCPEVAHLKDMLPTLIKNKEAKEFLKELEGQSSDTKKKRELGYREYKEIVVEYETVATLVGGSLNKPEKLAPEIKSTIEKLEKEKSKKKKTDEEYGAISYIERDFDGQPILRPNSIRQYFIKNLRIAGVGETAMNQVHFNKANIEPNGHKYRIEQWPIIVGGRGRGVKSAEALPPGIKIKTKFTYPFIGTKITTPDKLKKVLEYQAENGIGFGCYTKKYGKCKLISFEVNKLPWE